MSPFFRKTKLWDLYGDIQVELPHEATSQPAFLIPSGKVNPHLRETAYLRSEEGRAIVDGKRSAGEAFVMQWRNRELPGYKFTMRTKDGETRTKVYCAAYDRFLSDSLFGAGVAESR